MPKSTYTLCGSRQPFLSISFLSRIFEHAAFRGDASLGGRLQHDLRSLQAGKNLLNRFPSTSDRLVFREQVTGLSEARRDGRNLGQAHRVKHDSSEWNGIVESRRR